MISGDRENSNRDVMAEAILAREEIEEFPLKQGSSMGALPKAEVPRLAEHFFMRNGPRDAGDRNSEDQQPDNLNPEAAHNLARAYLSVVQ